jgi:hypothetical protein
MTETTGTERLRRAIHWYECGIVTSEELVGLVVFLSGSTDVSALINLLSPDLRSHVKRRVQSWPQDDCDGHWVEFPVLGTSEADRDRIRAEHCAARKLLRNYFAASDGASTQAGPIQEATATEGSEDGK